MIWLWFIFCVVVFLFGFVVIFGAPYLPTLQKQIDTALELLDLRPGQTVLELGCGDGRVLKAAAVRGLNAVGYELNPILALVARLRTRRYRKQVRVVWGNYWTRRWPQAEGIFVFLLDPYMEKLNKKIIQECRKPVKLVSFAFAVPTRRPEREKDGLYLYRYE